jgi:hypothetical protein
MRGYRDTKRNRRPNVDPKCVWLMVSKIGLGDVFHDSAK